jgi:hypothetical protein
VGMAPNQHAALLQDGNLIDLGATTSAPDLTRT